MERNAWQRHRAALLQLRMVVGEHMHLVPCVAKGGCGACQVGPDSSSCEGGQLLRDEADPERAP